MNELITGQMQVGENEFESREPAEVPIAGDPEANYGPTYASFANLLDNEGGDEGERVNQTLERDGTVGGDTDYSEYDVTLAEFIPETGHHIADVFWEYLNSSGTLRQQRRAGCSDPVLERRCLTYTPGNEDAWQVEMGNVGQHYYRWRYEQEPGGAIAQDPAAYAIANLR